MDRVMVSVRSGLIGALRRLRRDERGLTLAELLSAQLVAGVVLAAAGVLVILSLTSEQRVADKVNSISQGRIISTQLEQRLNSQLCLYPGEYTLNGATNGVAATSIVHAGANRIIYFADISERPAGATTGVGFEPYMRYLLAPTSGDGRAGGFLDAYRAPTTTTIPFNYQIGPYTSLASLASTAGADNVPPTSLLRRVGAGVSNAVGPTSGAALPYFEYFDKDHLGPNDAPMTITGGALSAAQIESVAKIRVNYRILGQSGKDHAGNGPTGLDDRTETFATDIFLRTRPNICDQLGT